MRFKWTGIIGALIVMIIAIALVSWASTEKYPINRHVSYSFTIQNQTNKAVIKPELYVYAPVKQTATQLCGKISSSHPFDLIKDDIGNQIIKFKIPDIAPYENKVITVEADVKFSDKPNKISIRNRKNYLKPEKYIESDNPIIVKTAEKLKASGKINTADNVFQWITQNIKYDGYIKDEKGALYALNYKKGDCTEFSDLFTSLCRADNIPSRTISGYIITGSTVIYPGGFHNWAEFYDSVWNIADVQNKTFMKNNSNYLAIKINSRNMDNPYPDFNRFHIKGEGLKVVMN